MSALAFVVALTPATAGGADLLDQARARHRAGDAEEALPLYMAALQALRDEGDSAGASTCLNNASVILYNQGKYERSRALAQQAVDLRRVLGDPRRTGRSLTNVGRALREQGRFDEAEGSFRAALAAARRAEDRRDQVVNHANLGVLAQMEGRYGDALAAIDVGLGLVRQAEGEAWTRRQRFVLLNNRGAIYERIGEFGRALADYSTILDLLDPGRESVPYLVNSATILRNLGDPHLALEKLEAAERLLDGAVDDPRLRANLLSNQGLVLHLNLRRLGEAREVLERAYALARESGDRSETMMVGNALGALYLDLELLDAAGQVFRDVLRQPASGSFREAAWEAHLGMGGVLQAKGDREGAIRALRTSVALVEGSRRNLLPEFVPRRFLADRLVAYAVLAGILAQGGAEGIRAGLLTAERARERFLLPRGLSPEPTDGWQDDLLHLSAAALRSYEEPGTEAVEVWRELHHRWTSRGPVHVPAAAPVGEAWVVYLIAGEDARVFWMTPHGVETLALPSEEEIGRLVVSWLDALLAGSEHETERGSLLYEAVLGPVLEALPAGTHTLRVASDGPLWRVPLDALPRAVDDTRRLLEDYEVTLLPLLSFNDRPRARSPSRAGGPSFAFFGPPASLPEGLPRLPEAMREAEALRRAFGSDGPVFAGRDASEARLREALHGPARVLHVATHATADPVDAGRTGIVLQAAEGGELQRADDGFLSLPELADQEIAADLVFLSACSGAVGERLPGEGVESLAAVLLESGSGAVVASLWDVADIPTRALVEQFYDEIGRGRTIAAALREAKRALLRSGGRMAEPRHWAAWVALGSGEQRLARARPDWLTWTLVLAALALVFLAARAAIRSTRRP